MQDEVSPAASCVAFAFDLWWNWPHMPALEMYAIVIGALRMPIARRMHLLIVFCWAHDHNQIEGTVITICTSCCCCCCCWFWKRIKKSPQLSALFTGHVQVSDCCNWSTKWPIGLGQSVSWIGCSFGLWQTSVSGLAKKSINSLLCSP